MAEQAGGAPTPPPAEAKAPAPTPEAPKPAVENTAAETASAPVDKLSDGSDINKLADDIKNGNVDVDAEFQKMAGEPQGQQAGAESASADGQAQTPATEAPSPTPEATAQPAVENPNPPVAGQEQPAAGPQSADAQTGDKYDIESQQARIDDMMNKTPDELNKLAAEGNVLAKKALRDMEKQVSQNPDAPDPNDKTVEQVMNQNPNYTEPSAEQRANNDTVEATNVNVPPAVEPPPTTGEKPVIGAKQNPDGTWDYSKAASVEFNNVSPASTEATPAQVVQEAEQIAKEAADVQAENKDAEMTPEQKAVAEAKLTIEGVQSLAKLGVDINSPEGQKVLDLMAENPQYAEAYKAAAEAAGANMAIGGPEAAAAAAEATANSLDDKIAQAEKDGNSDEVKRLGFLKTLLKAMGVALLAAGAVLVGAPVVGTLATANAAAKSGQK